MCLLRVITTVWLRLRWPLQRDPYKKTWVRAMGRAKVKRDGHKYLGWSVIIMASWVCLEASQCGSGNCRMDGMREWEDRDTHLKTDYQRDGQKTIESEEKDKTRQRECFRLWPTENWSTSDVNVIHRQNWLQIGPWVTNLTKSYDFELTGVASVKSLKFNSGNFLNEFDEFHFMKLRGKPSLTRVLQSEDSLHSCMK